MIIIIDNYDSFTYNLYQAFARIYPDVRVFRNDKITVADIKQLNPSAIVLSPGPGRPEDAGICIELVQQLATTIPILGVCLGHQAIASAFAGNIVQAQSIVHGKATLVFHNRQELFAQMPLPFQAARYHSLLVDKKTLPSCLNILAENEEGLIMCIKHQQFPCYGIQFHPESILTPQGDRLLNNFIQLACSSNTTEAHAC